jgi:biotin synthase
MGEEAIDCVDMLATLVNLPEHPESVPINMLIRIAFVRTIALARILMAKSFVRLSVGRCHDR